MHSSSPSGGALQLPFTDVLIHTVPFTAAQDGGAFTLVFTDALLLT